MKFARYRVSDRRLLEWSTAAFTTAAGPGQADAEISDVDLPAALASTRLTATLGGLEVDPTNPPLTSVAKTDASVDAEDAAWMAGLLLELPGILAEHAQTGKIDAPLWLGRLRARVKVARRPRGTP